MGEGWPGGEESSQFREETGRGEEKRKGAWGRGRYRNSKKLFVMGIDLKDLAIFMR